jgi:hypothetical protein
MPSAPNTASGLIFTGYTTGAFAGPLLGELISPAPAGWLEMAALPAAGLLVLFLRARFSRRTGLGHRPELGDTATPSSPR